MMAVGMAPACLASEVASFLCIPGSRQWCHKLCGKGGPPRGGGRDSMGCSQGRAGEGRQEWESWGIKEKRA